MVCAAEPSINTLVLACFLVCVAVAARAVAAADWATLFLEKFATPSSNNAVFTHKQFGSVDSRIFFATKTVIISDRYIKIFNPISSSHQVKVGEEIEKISSNEAVKKNVPAQKRSRGKKVFTHEQTPDTSYFSKIESTSVQQQQTVRSGNMNQRGPVCVATLSRTFPTKAVGELKKQAWYADVPHYFFLESDECATIPLCTDVREHFHRHAYLMSVSTEATRTRRMPSNSWAAHYCGQCPRPATVPTRRPRLAGRAGLGHALAILAPCCLQRWQGHLLGTPSSAAYCSSTSCCRHCPRNASPLRACNCRTNARATSPVTGAGVLTA